MLRLLKRLQGRWALALQSDTRFIEEAYRQILGRNADLDGLNHYRRILREGVGRTAVLLDIMRSDEFTSRLARTAQRSLPNLRAMRPDRYRDVIDRSNGQTISVFDAASAADFDWLEAAITQHGYYEKPGVWNLRVDSDKRVVAEIIRSFAPQRALELGCAAGAVLDCLQDDGIVAEGIEISSLALSQAPMRVRDRIHTGDLLSLNLRRDYDLVFGLDIFEHLNPNRMATYVSRLCDITRDGAHLFCNIPAFGEDAVFGTVFPMYVDGWERDAATRRPFSSLHVDELGYPIHGHLTWADARWWSERFAAGGFLREVEIERALHGKYDDYMRARAPARRSFFVFAKGASPAGRSAIIRRIMAEPSKVLG
jgi:hypothetical protein